MKLVVGLVGMIITSGVFAQAGGISGGGGGNSVVCFQDDQIVSARLLDLYEGEKYGLTYETETDDFNVELTRIAHKLFPDRKEHAEGFIERANLIKSNYKRIPFDTRLESIPDSLHIYVPKKCKVLQTVNFYSQNEIWIDGEIYDKLSFVDQLALLVHETIYFEERYENVADSRYARRITALAMSQINPFNNPYSKAEKGYKCGLELNNKNTIAFFLPLNEEQTNWRVVFTILNGHSMYAMKSLEFVSSEDPFKSTDENVQINYMSKLESPIDSNDTAIISFHEGRPYITWNGSHPGESFSRRFNCYELEE